MLFKFIGVRKMSFNSTLFPSSCFFSHMSLSLGVLTYMWVYMYVCVGPGLILEIFDHPPFYSFGARSFSWTHSSLLRLLLLASLFWDTPSLPSEWHRWATMLTQLGTWTLLICLHDSQALYSESHLLSPSEKGHTLSHMLTPNLQ